MSNHFIYAVALTGLVSWPAHAQAPTSATDVTKAEIEAVRTYQGKVVTDRQVKVVDAGPYNIGVGILHRGQLAASDTVGGLIHSLVTEAYYILSGSGTLVTGGTLAGATPLAADGESVKVLIGPSLSGTVQGGQRRVVSEGDVVIIPAGVPHGFAEIPDHVTYLSIRPDSKEALPAGYVHPAIRK